MSISWGFQQCPCVEYLEDNEFYSIGQMNKRVAFDVMCSLPRTLGLLYIFIQRNKNKACKSPWPKICWGKGHKASSLNTS